MRKVIAYELLSLDGVAESPNEFISEWDSAMDDNLARVIGSQDTVVLGRRTYDEWAGFWPTSEIEPFATFINRVDKFVATSTPLATTWENATIVNGALPEFVAQLKRQSGDDIGLHGSIALVQSLLTCGLVDELRLVVAPSVHAEGRKLFETCPPTRLTLTRQLASPTGYLLLDFEVGG